MNKINVFSPLLKTIGKCQVIDIIDKGAISEYEIEGNYLLYNGESNKDYSIMYRVLEDEFIELEKNLCIRVIKKINICKIYPISIFDKSAMNFSIMEAEKILKNRFKKPLKIIKSIKHKK